MLLAAAATFAGASLQSAVGFGFALVLSPALFAALGPYEAVTALLVLGLALNALMLFEDGRPGPVRWGALRPMLLAALPGLAVGVALLALLGKPALQVGVGVAVLGAVLVQARSPALRARREASLRSACAVGLASGALTTSTSVSGPPIVLWLQAQGARPDELRASTAASFLALNLAGAATVLLAGGVGSLDATVVLPLLVLTAVGHVVGARIFRAIDPDRFRSAALALVLAAGVASVAAGLAAAL
jgi:uncharacterized protein